MLMAEDQNQAGFSYHPDDDGTELPAAQSAPAKPAKANQPISWTGSEFIANQKGPGWYGTFLLGLIVLVGTVFAITRDYISTVSIAVVGILFLILANRKPRQLTYQIDDKGVSVGSRFYPFEHFKSFAVAQDGAIGYINLLPLKRFLPEVSIYFPPEQGDKIIGILASHLPHDAGGERQIDRLAKKLRF